MKTPPEFIQKTADDIEDLHYNLIGPDDIGLSSAVIEAITKALAKMVICGALDSKLVEECSQFLEEK